MPKKARSHYTAEDAGRLVARWTDTRERLRKRLRGLESAMDLDRGVKALDPRLKKRIAKLVREGFEPGRIEGGRYPDPDELVKVVIQLREDGQVREANILSRSIRDIRLLQALAVQMTGRRRREPLLTKADRRVVGRCEKCDEGIKLGESVYWDRDNGKAWHESHGLQ